MPPPVIWAMPRIANPVISLRTVLTWILVGEEDIAEGLAQFRKDIIHRVA